MRNGLLRVLAGLCVLLVLAACGCVSDVQDTGEKAGTVTVQETDTGMVPDAEERYGQVEVLSDPPFAAILVDGVYTGSATPAVVRMSAGRHTIAAESSFGRVSSAEVDVWGNETVELLFSQEVRTGQFLRDGDLSDTGFFVVDSNEREVYVSVFGRMQNALRTGTGSVIRNAVEMPYVIPGLREGKVKVAAEVLSGTSVIREVPVASGLFSSVYYMFGGGDQWRNLSVSSEVYAGMAYSVSGFLAGGVLPGEREWPVSATFVSVMTPEGIVSYPRGAGNWSEMVIEPREVVWYDILVTSPVAGADIVVDGFPTGYTTPWTIRNVSDGFHVITVSKPGFLPVSREVALGGPAGVTQVMMPAAEMYASGFLAVNSSEPGSRVVMYGRDTGDRTPVMYAGFPAGKREVTVVSPDGRSRMFEMTIVPDVVNEVFADF